MSTKLTRMTSKKKLNPISILVKMLAISYTGNRFDQLQEVYDGAVTDYPRA